MLHQLTYISTARPTLILSDVEQILQASRRRNERDQVTGLLIFDGKRFLQALEGPIDAVEQTFARIATDPRHRALVKLSSRHVDTREFGNWSMGSHLTGPVMGKGDVVGHVEAMTESLTDPNVRETLRGFARLRSGSPS
ncbi:BLUF domain-containing protein [Sphingomonas sp. SRS2]|uniref:BLUF domain-containing protein n=1 Tax=Sphingomonas sp. SRS2 TaxID=133190 RepID=UPI000698E993|nr:BLUF domain-containing protein [Sphingomonas sp. SRS2]